MSAAENAMHPYRHAAEHPDRLALVMADTGETLTYAQLEAASNRAAQLFRAHGLKPGDVIAIMLRNGPAYPTAYWGAQRAGLMLTPISTHLRADEAAHIINDCGARLVLLDPGVGETAAALAADHARLTPAVERVYAIADLPGAEGWEAALAGMQAERIADEISGYYLVYSSGTTGRPKGVVLPFTPGPIDVETERERNSRLRLAEFGALVTFSAAPMYHAAPLAHMMMTHRAGGTSVFLTRFDPVAALKAIAAWRVNVASMVPTMFIRLLALPEAERRAHDLSSLRCVMHAAAPCPVEVKRRMMAWLGPILYESYSGSEANGRCSITPQEWLRKPGSVGRATWGALHICDEAGEELPAGESGLIYFEGPKPAEYRNDPEKTARSRHPRHPTWSTLGDIGFVDQDGYLFLNDRKDFMIVSGGVNIYPQAVEDVLIQHPKVADVAVIGAPNPMFGEEVKAVVQPHVWADAGEALAAELIDFCRTRVSDVSRPRSVDFVEALPRLPTGKLAKHEVRRRYWPQAAAPAAAVTAGC